MKDLDRRLAALGQAEIDRDLLALETDVWRKVDAVRAPSATNPIVAGVGATVALIAWAAGVVAATAAPSYADSSAFAIHARYAPSTVLFSKS